MNIDWTKSMRQSYEFWEVDPYTWKDIKRIDDITSCNIKRDSSSSLIETATVSSTKIYDECYVRVYLSVLQDTNEYLNNYNSYELLKKSKRIPLGTFVIQTPKKSYTSKGVSISMDAYSPLIELRDTKPPLGFTTLKSSMINKSILEQVCKNISDNSKIPIIETSDDTKLQSNYTANVDESWLDYNNSLLANAKISMALDELGRIYFRKEIPLDALQPVWTFTDDDSSILEPDVEDSFDLYGVPNTVEVVYSGTKSTGESFLLRSVIVNDDPNSITSTVNRKRTILYRDTNPSVGGTLSDDKASQEYLDLYAKQLLEKLSSIEHTITFTHGYCPVKLGDCVRLNYKRAGLTNVKALITNQTIECVSGCKISETAVYNEKLWKAV